MQEKLLSVLIPAFGNISGVSRILESFALLDCTEIIVSDDSIELVHQQAIKALCETYEAEYVEGPRQGAIYNWNYLLKRINTPYYVIIHHDESFSDMNWLQKIDFMRDDKIYILPYMVQSHKNRWRWHSSAQQKEHFQFWSDYLAYYNFIGPTACIILPSSKVVEFDSNLKWLVDCEWYYRNLCGQKFSSLVYLTESYVKSYHYQNSITWGSNNTLRNLFNTEAKYISKKYTRSFQKRNLVFVKLLMRLKFLSEWIKRYEIE